MSKRLFYSTTIILQKITLQFVTSVSTQSGTYLTVVWSKEDSHQFAVIRTLTGITRKRNKCICMYSNGVSGEM
jgi:hypothetical protein